MVIYLWHGDSPVLGSNVQNRADFLYLVDGCVHFSLRQLVSGYTTTEKVDLALIVQDGLDSGETLLSENEEPCEIELILFDQETP